MKTVFVVGIQRLE